MDTILIQDILWFTCILQRLLSTLFSLSLIPTGINSPILFLLYPGQIIIALLKKKSFKQQVTFSFIITTEEKAAVQFIFKTIHH